MRAQSNPKHHNKTCGSPGAARAGLSTCQSSHRNDCKPHIWRRRALACAFTRSLSSLPAFAKHHLTYTIYLLKAPPNPSGYFVWWRLFVPDGTITATGEGWPHSSPTTRFGGRALQEQRAPYLTLSLPELQSNSGQSGCEPRWSMPRARGI